MRKTGWWFAPGTARWWAVPAGAALVAVVGMAAAERTDDDPVPSAQPTRVQASVDALDVDTLKSAYLACNRASERGLLGSGEVAHCSVLYEELKRRGFDDDFYRFLDWSRTQR